MLQTQSAKALLIPANDNIQDLRGKGKETGSGKASVPYQPFSEPKEFPVGSYSQDFKAVSA